VCCAGMGGIGGTTLTGGLFGDLVASSVKIPSSMLESRLWDSRRASLCFAEEAISVS
jgi:hypothetical protein